MNDFPVADMVRAIDLIAADGTRHWLEQHRRNTGGVHPRYQRSSLAKRADPAEERRHLGRSPPRGSSSVPQPA